MAEDLHKRRRVYGRRRGHKLRQNRQVLMESTLPALAVDLATVSAGAPALDLQEIFGVSFAAAELEIGFGTGEHLVEQARENPMMGFIGCEYFINGIASLLAALDRERLNNVRIFVGDARDLLDALPAACFQRVYLLFPDPWPKRRHAKRRFINGANIAALARVLEDGGELRIATDHMAYCRWCLQHLAASAEFEWTARHPRDWRCRPADWPATRYERKALQDSRSCVYLSYRRTHRSTAQMRTKNELSALNP